jgi:hypothetical protein
MNDMTIISTRMKNYTKPVCCIAFVFVISVCVCDSIKIKAFIFIDLPLFLTYLSRKNYAGKS